MDDQIDQEHIDNDPVVDNPWQSLRAFTSARIALGRAGISLPTRHHLDFQLAYARARDAVHSELDVPQLLRDLSSIGHEAIVLRSAAGDRRTYLQRPDLGRRLNEYSRERLVQHDHTGFDVAFIIADGLSALAVQRHTVPLLDTMLPRLESERWRVAPVTIVTQGRVAISDEIGALLRADQAVILIGERPGLSSPDSLGVYLTYSPRIGNTDADRNCISNIRTAGLSYDEAARKLVYLMTEACRREVSGVALKDESDAHSQIAARNPDGELNAGPVNG